ncbi:MAG: superoxide dismutase family protein [bacterium]|nr:superoxide dismutase family protein [bacterium]
MKQSLLSFSKIAGLIFAACFIPSAATAQPVMAKAVLAPTSGNTAHGLITFTESNGVVKVNGQVEGLSAGGHGFHIHETGDCSAADGSSAGGHFNPTTSEHGAPGAAAHHAGDLGNLVADEAGVAKIDGDFPFLTLQGEHSIVGRGLIVHAMPDDLVTQPTGNAGARVACAVISAAEPPIAVP